MKQIRVLHIFDEISNSSGVSKVVENISDISKTNFAFDYLVYSRRSKGYFKNLNTNNSRIYIIKKFGIFTYIKYKVEYEKLLQKNQYDIVHLHTPITSIVHLRLAKKMGVQKRIVHSHNSKLADLWIKKIRNRLLINLGLKYANYLIACSTIAGNALFKQKRNKEFFTLKNSVDINKFEFNKQSRKAIREKYKLFDSPLILHTGRMCKQKNHIFLLKIFAEVTKIIPDIKLLLLGDGELKKRLKKLSDKLGLLDKVYFIGEVKNPEDFMSASDILLLPSLYEGFPLVGIEAQANGLKCIFSDNITREVKINCNVDFLSIKDSKEWVSKIILLLHGKDETKRAINKQDFREVSIDGQNELLLSYYNNIIYDN